MLGRIFKKFEYDDFVNLSHEYTKLLRTLKLYFNYLCSGSKGNQLNVSDDGYWDLMSSVIGKGKNFIISCIADNNILINMAKNDNYAENFGYIWNESYIEYVRIRSKYDPLYRDINKYNV